MADEKSHESDDPTPVEPSDRTAPAPKASMIGKALDGLIRFCLENKLVVFLILAAAIGWGIIVMPFDYDITWLERNPVPVDAIPDIGENQQIVFTEWPGRSPQDIEDQITYPLTVSLLGVPGVKTIRSYSYFGFSSIYVIFKETVDVYWSRSRILERLSVAQKELPEGAVPQLGPDATALGQIFWYTLEGHDTKTGKPIGGWDLDELRSIQDWQVRYALQAAEGVSEVASIGGFVREYQVDVDPDAMRAHGVTLEEVFDAVRKSNIDVGARTIEINRVEYIIRSLGFVKEISDLADTVIKSTAGVPIYIGQVANVTTGPAMRRGALDKAGTEAVGGVVVVRYGENPLTTIKNVKQKIEEISAGLPQKTLEDGRVSQVTIVPFYDRTQLIHETLGTLQTAISQQILITIIVVLVMVMHFRSSFLISSLLPLAVLLAFIAMKVFGVDSNIMSLSGIAIAIGTMVDIGVILCENILKHLDEADPRERRIDVVFRAASEVGRPVLTAVLTTIVSFLPVFVMVGAEGKLFKPLAFTKTFALIASVLVALTLIPPVAHMILGDPRNKRLVRFIAAPLIFTAGIVAGAIYSWWIAAGIIVFALYLIAQNYLSGRISVRLRWILYGVSVLLIMVVLSGYWMPLGIQLGELKNFIFVFTMISSLLAVFHLFMVYYAPILRFFLRHKLVFYMLPLTSLVLGFFAWLGPGVLFGRIPREYAAQSLKVEDIRALSNLDRLKYELAGLRNRPWPDDVENRSFLMKAKWTLAKSWSGLGKEFMPPLDEGSFLLMPTMMAHASIGEALDVVKKQDIAISRIPEIESVVGKIGRAESPLDPAPISMIETIINYKSEYRTDRSGRRIRYAYHEAEDGKIVYLRDSEGELIPDGDGRPFRQWRDEIRSPNDIWLAIEQAARVPGTTSAPKLQPIAARLVMLQSGVRAPMAVRIRGKSLEDIERIALDVEELLKQVPSVNPEAVVADRIVGKPYLEIDIDRRAIARYGISIAGIQHVIETAVGGRKITTTVEGRERYPVRVRYQRELRDSIEQLGRILVASPSGAQIPLGQLATIRYARGPMVIKSEDAMLVGYVIFDKLEGHAEVDVVEECQEFLDRKLPLKLESENRTLPAGTEITFIGSYLNQVRSTKTLRVVMPIALLIIFIILYLQFRSIFTTLLIFFGVFIACSGGFMLLWLYGLPWFADFDIFGVNMRDLFHMRTINMSVAVWVGFIALFGIATDDGVIMASYLDQSFRKQKHVTKEAIREATVEAGRRRIRPCLMTTATTILALLPVLTSIGRGSDVMVPMAIPSFGGMLIELMTLFFVPVTYCLIQEVKMKFGRRATSSEIA